MKDVEARLAALEIEVRSLSDRLAIYQLIASYGPAVDTRSEAATAALWSEDGTYDFGGTPLQGAAQVARLVHGEPHAGYVENGCAHVMAMPHVQIAGDAAVATGYSRVYEHRGDTWQVVRASANCWQLRREAHGWRVLSRINRPLDGSPEARALLAGAFTPFP